MSTVLPLASSVFVTIPDPGLQIIFGHLRDLADIPEDVFTGFDDGIKRTARNVIGKTKMKVEHSVADGKNF